MTVRSRSQAEADDAIGTKRAIEVAAKTSRKD